MLLGRAPRPAGARFARLRDHLTVPLPAAPASWDGLIDTVTLRMLGNDRYGDCTFAAVGNLAAIQSAGDGLPMVLEEKLVVSEYLDHTDGRDEGAVVIDVHTGEVVVLDSRTGRATINGGDVTGNMTAKQWFTVPPGATRRYQLTTLGSTSGSPTITLNARAAYL